MSTQRLGRRSWLWADGARLAGPAVVLVGLVTAVAVTTSDQDQAIAMAAVVGAGILGHFVLRARFGYRAVHKREIGRASCRERGESGGVAGVLKRESKARRG